MTIRDLTCGILGAIYASGVWLLFSYDLPPALGGWLIAIWVCAGIALLAHMVIKSFGES